MCAKINLAKFFRNTTHLGLAKFFPGENVPLYGNCIPKRDTYVIVVPWVSRVYGICTLRAVICIPEGAARGNTYNCAKSTNPYTLETHGTGDLYHNTITNLLVMTSANGEAFLPGNHIP